MATYPRDQFDDVPDNVTRVGAHRAPAKRGRGWVRLGWAALATVVLIAAGLYGLSRIDPSFELPLPDLGGDEQAGPSASALPTADPVTDPSEVDPAVLETLTLSVFNGSPADGAQDAAADQLVAAGWPDPARANASDRTEETTTIYYRSSEYEGIARGMAELLGAGDVQLSDAFLGAQITIVLGEDYTPPAG